MSTREHSWDPEGFPIQLGRRALLARFTFERHGPTCGRCSWWAVCQFIYRFFLKSKSISVQPLWGTVRRALKKLKIGLPHDPAIPLLHRSEKNKNTKSKDTCIPAFIAALFTRAETWKQPKCPSTDEWIKMLHIYTMEYYSAIKRNEIELFVMR